MHKFFIVFLFLAVSCSQNKTKEQTEVKDLSVAGNSTKATENEKQLDKKLWGEWINTALFDSTLSQKKLAPWLPSFYGEIYLKISANDSIAIEGNMDGGKTKIAIDSPYRFTLSELSTEPTFTYSENLDLLLRTSPYDTFLFRRKRSTDNLSFMADEEKFNNYFLKQLFEGNYLDLTFNDQTKITVKNKSFLGDPKKTKIKRLWSGFETFTPFGFDAIQLSETGQKEPQFYGWEFSGDTLKLYSTTNKFDEESGFSKYKRGKLYRKLIKQKS